MFPVQQLLCWTASAIVLAAPTGALPYLGNVTLPDIRVVIGDNGSVHVGPMSTNSSDPNHSVQPETTNRTFLNSNSAPSISDQPKRKSANIDAISDQPNRTNNTTGSWYHGLLSPTPPTKQSTDQPTILKRKSANIEKFEDVKDEPVVGVNEATKEPTATDKPRPKSIPEIIAETIEQMKEDMEKDTFLDFLKQFDLQDVSGESFVDFYEPTEKPTLTDTVNKPIKKSL